MPAQSTAKELMGYFDYNATTPVCTDVVDAMRPTLSMFANPSSNSWLAKESKQAVSQAREQVASLLGTQPEHIFFTSGGSESNNWAIKGVLFGLLNSPGHIITTAIEHPSVLRTLEYCQRQLGFDVTYLKSGRTGAISIADVESVIRQDTQLISVMFANNETGAIQPIEEIAAIAKKHAIPFHVDAVQLVGKQPINVEALGVDYLSLSAHKFYGPKGLGCLYVRDKTVLSPLIHGGGQESHMRSGTENLLAMTGVAKAAEKANLCVEQWHSTNWQNKQLLMQLLEDSSMSVTFNGSVEQRKALTNTLNISIAGIRGEALALRLELNHGIQISIGSACSSNSDKQLSHVLVAMGLNEPAIQGAIRISFGTHTTQQSIRQFVAALECEVQALKVMRGSVAYA